MNYLLNELKQYDQELHFHEQCLLDVMNIMLQPYFIKSTKSHVLNNAYALLYFHNQNEYNLIRYTL